MNDSAPHSDKKKILIIGASGGVGMATRDAITQFLGADVLTYDRPDGDAIKRAERKEKYEYIVANQDKLLDGKQAQWLLAGHTPLPKEEQGTSRDVESIRAAMEEGVNEIIISAGMPRKIGMERKDLLTMNAAIFKDLGEKIADIVIDNIKAGKDFHLPVIINAGNPMDTMTEILGRTLHSKLTEAANEAAAAGDKNIARALGEEARVLHGKVIGQGGILDSARAAMAIHNVMGIPLENITHVPVIGTHNENMVANLPKAKVRYMGHEIELRHLPKTSSNGLKLDNTINVESSGETKEITVTEEINRQMRLGGTQVAQNYKQLLDVDQSAILATGAALMKMTDSILHDKGVTMAAAVYHPPLLSITNENHNFTDKVKKGSKIKDGFVMGHMTALGKDGAIDVDLTRSSALQAHLQKAEAAARTDVGTAMGR